MTFFKPRFILLAIALLSAGSLGAAYIGEYFFALKPCIICLYQRYAYMATIAVALMGACLPQPRQQISMIFTSGALFFVNFGIATYQVLVEKKILTPPGVCKGIEIDTLNQTFAQFKATLSQAGNTIPCDIIAWDLFGISMAGYNALFTLLSAFACLTMAMLFYAPFCKNNRKHGNHCHGP